MPSLNPIREISKKVEPVKKFLGEGRELSEYIQETQRIINNSDSPETEMENLLNAGRFRKMSRRFFPFGLFREDIELEAAMEYYNKRKQGHKVDRSFVAAKFKAFHIALDYYKLVRTYEPMEDCECDQCHVGRPSKCLNGTPVIRPRIDEISIDSTLENGQLVSNLIALETPDKYQDYQWIMHQVKLLYESCNDRRNTRIIDGTREGKKQKEIASEMGITQSGINRRLYKISERFLAIEESR